ncbi:unnamed protein product [Caenorhabditis angaria]|uniref:Uncharacterized protein n=1 Tax=Caenorhabditis angaria TaxID=860376 RepID=A0A9P1ILS4_9PELO|nr:unnamed protein product [Caenorhabditis angaria]
MIENRRSSRIRKSVVELLGVDPSNYAPTWRALKTRRRASRTPTTRTKQGEKLDDFGYAIPKQVQKPIQQRPSIDVLMSMSLDELQNSIPTENFDFEPTLSKLRQAFEEVDLRDDNFDFIEHEEIASKHHVLPESSDYCEHPLTSDITSRSLYKYIIEEDVERFFEYVGRFIKDHQELYCRGQCFYAIFESDWMSERFKLNPLHIAAAMNKPKFIKSVVNNSTHWFKHSEHYVHFCEIVRGWLFDANTYERSIPAEIAAELGHAECVRLLISEEVIEFLARKKGAVERRTYNAYAHGGADRFLCKLAYNNQINILSNEELLKLVQNYTDSHLRLAICDAMCSGSLDSAKRIYYSSGKEHLLSNEIAPIRLPGRQFQGKYKIVNQEVRWTPVQFALTSGYPEILTGIPQCLRFPKDCFGYTPLVQCVDLDDKNLNYAISLYRRNADREDLLVFIYQLLLKNRINFFLLEFEFFLTNFDFFTHRPKFDEKYNLPEHAVLPLSSALVLNVEMWVMERIRGIYRQFRNAHNQGMLDEDVIRCYKYMQHYQFKFSDQIRLAVYLLLAPLTIGLAYRNPKWEEIMALNSKNFGFDPVYIYWIDNLQKVKTPTNYTWQNALDEAGTIVDTWQDATKELVQNVTSLKLAKSSQRDLKQSLETCNNSQISGTKRGILKKF